MAFSVADAAQCLQWVHPANALSTAGAVSTTDFEAYGYDASDNRTSVKRRDGRTLSYAFDALNRLTSKIVPDGCAPIQTGACTPASATRDVFYAYDLRGLQTAARYDSASGSDAVVQSYDGFKELTSSTTSMGGFSRTVTFQFDADGNRTRVTHPDGNFFVFGYDGLDRQASILENGATAISSMAYFPQGEISTLNRGATVSSYGYDPIYRPTSVADDLAGSTADLTTTFSYNPVGQVINRTRTNDSYAWTGAVNVARSYVHNGLNQYTSAGPASFLYDANGNLITDGTNTYLYDAENRLVGAGAVTLTYDPLGRLTDAAVVHAGQKLDGILGTPQKPGPTNYSAFPWIGGNGTANSNSAAAKLVDMAKPGTSDKITTPSGFRTPGFRESDQAGTAPPPPVSDPCKAHPGAC